MKCFNIVDPLDLNISNISVLYRSVAGTYTHIYLLLHEKVLLFLKQRQKRRVCAFVFLRACVCVHYIWLQKGDDVWAVCSNGGSSFSHVMNTICLIHHKDTQHSSTILLSYLLLSSVVGKHARRVVRHLNDSHCYTKFDTFH